MSAWFYILRLRSQGLYCGSTKDLQSRLKDHFSGYGARTSRIDPPIFLTYSEEYPTYKEAFRREQQVKRWSRAKKEVLIKGDFESLKRLSKRKK
jgi:putative endonuclease